LVNQAHTSLCRVLATGYIVSFGEKAISWLLLRVKSWNQKQPERSLFQLVVGTFG